MRRNKKVNPGRDVQGLGGGVERAWEPRARTAVRKERVLWAVRNGERPGGRRDSPCGHSETHGEYGDDSQVPGGDQAHSSWEAHLTLSLNSFAPSFLGSGLQPLPLP